VQAPNLVRSAAFSCRSHTNAAESCIGIRNGSTTTCGVPPQVVEICCIIRCTTWWCSNSPAGVPPAGHMLQVYHLQHIVVHHLFHRWCTTCDMSSRCTTCWTCHSFLLCSRCDTCSKPLQPSVAKQNKGKLFWHNTTKAPQWCNDVIYHHFKKSGLQEECCKSLILKQWYHYFVKFSFSLIFLVLAYWENNAFLVGPKLCLVSWLKI